MRDFIVGILLLYSPASMLGQSLIKFEEKGKNGFKDAQGVVIVPAKYQSVSEFTEGIAGVFLNGKWALIDSTGKLITPAKYDEIGPIKAGGFVRAYIAIGQKWGVINKAGKEIVPVKFDEVGEEFRHGLITVCGKMKCGLYNQLGVVVLSLDYENCRALSPDLAVVTKSKKEGMIEIQPSGIDVITKKQIHVQLIPFEYDLYSGIKWFTKSLLLLQKDGKWGLANLNGMAVLPAENTVIYPFKNGRAKVVKTDNSIFYVNEEGMRIFE